MNASGSDKDKRLVTTERLAGSSRIQVAQPALVFHTGERTGESIPISRFPFVVGSADDVQLRLEERGVSRHHFEIRLKDDNYLLVDHGSTNGTFVNGTSVLEAYLHPGDTIAIGVLQLRFEGRVTDADVQPGTKENFGDLYGSSPAMRRLFAMLGKVAPSDTSVLITGETGTGKDLVAQALHQHSPRAQSPFCVLDCSAVTGDLLTAELFGHTEGAFTGAAKPNQGIFEAADGGTVFIDEIGELPLDLQPKLLRVLENRQVKPLGSNRAIPVNVRVLAATHRDLPALVAEGKFRQDLYYRLAVVRIHLPPLRERTEDIAGLAERLLKGLRSIHGAYQLSQPALARLLTHAWKGNVRELRNVLERATALATERMLEVDDLDLIAEGGSPVSPAPVSTAPVVAGSGGRLDAAEMDTIQRVLDETGGNQVAAAKKLGIHRDTLRAKIQRYGLTIKKR
jgi:DNA-binding NtrC family response regulator